MDNKLFLSADDFEARRLNKSFFTNINKGLTEEQFGKAYPDTKYDSFEKGVVESWITGVYQATGGEIVKGGFNDTADVHQVLEGMKSQVSLLKGVIVEGADGSVREVFVCPKQEIEKSNDTEEEADGDSLEKAKGNDLEKGKIADALRWGDLPIKFNKTGAEIKEKLAAIKTKEMGKLGVLEATLSSLAEQCVYKPTEKYSYDDGDDDMKVFKWDMTYENNQNSVQLSPTETGTITNEEARLCAAYNDTVYKLRDVKKELTAIEVLEENLDDSKKYELTAAQMLTFCF